MNCWDYGSINIFVAYHNNLPVGATMLASYMGFFENMFFATISDYRRHYISDYLNWEMITYSIIEKNDKLSTSNKESVYSFGRSSDNSGVYKYKNHWPVTNYRLYNYQNFFDIRKKNWLYYMWGKLPNNLVSYLSPKLIKHIY